MNAVVLSWPAGGATLGFGGGRALYHHAGDRAVIFALAAVGLNIALGFGGLVSLGHAAFFGMGGYAMGILAHHAQTFTPLAEWPFLIEGTKSMPVIWLVAMVTSAVAALLIGRCLCARRVSISS